MGEPVHLRERKNRILSFSFISGMMRDQDDAIHHVLVLPRDMDLEASD